MSLTLLTIPLAAASLGVATPPPAHFRNAITIPASSLQDPALVSVTTKGDRAIAIVSAFEFPSGDPLRRDVYATLGSGSLLLDSLGDANPPMYPGGLTDDGRVVLWRSVADNPDDSEVLDFDGTLTRRFLLSELPGQARSRATESRVLAGPDAGLAVFTQAASSGGYVNTLWRVADGQAPADSTVLQPGALAPTLTPTLTLGLLGQSEAILAPTGDILLGGILYVIDPPNPVNQIVRGLILRPDESLALALDAEPSIGGLLPGETFDTPRGIGAYADPTHLGIPARLASTAGPVEAWLIRSTDGSVEVALRETDLPPTISIDTDDWPGATLLRAPDGTLILNAIAKDDQGFDAPLALVSRTPGTLEPLVAPGDPTPDGADTFVGSKAILTSDGVVILEGILASGGSAIFAIDPGCQNLRPLIRPGDQLHPFSSPLTTAVLPDPAQPGVPHTLDGYVPVVTKSQFGANVILVGYKPADWNADAIENDQDFFDFVNDFFAEAGPRGHADFNADGVTNDQDFFGFVNAFFGNPC